MRNNMPWNCLFSKELFRCLVYCCLALQQGHYSCMASGLLASGLLASGLLASGLLASGLLASGLLASGLLASGLLASGLLASAGAEQGHCQKLLRGSLAPLLKSMWYCGKTGPTRCPCLKILTRCIIIPLHYFNPIRLSVQRGFEPVSSPPYGGSRWWREGEGVRWVRSNPLFVSRSMWKPGNGVSTFQILQFSGGACLRTP